MRRTTPPAIDVRFRPELGATRNGQPISYNRAPAEDLQPWLGRVSVTKLQVPEGQKLSCGLFADTAGLRIQPKGDFEVDLPDGTHRHGRSALFCGPQTRMMPVRITGEFVSIGVTFRPSACAALIGPEATVYVDQVTPTRTMPAEHLLPLFPPDASPEEWLCNLEEAARRHLAQIKLKPEPVTALFEEIMFRDPTMPVAQAAREIGVDRRRLERLVVRDFGMSPKQVLKRARALDMASYLLGVADDDEGAALTLRYYDESHLIREFVELFGMSPRQFAAQPLPLLTLTLEARQARRLEMTQRLTPGMKRPWE